MKILNFINYYLILSLGIILLSSCASDSYVDKPDIKFNILLPIAKPYNNNTSWLIIDNVYKILRNSNSKIKILKPGLVKERTKVIPENNINYPKLAQSLDAQGCLTLELVKTSIPNLNYYHNLTSNEVITRESYIQINLTITDLSNKIFFNKEIFFKDIENYFYQPNITDYPNFKSFDEEFSFLINGISEKIISILSK